MSSYENVVGGKLKLKGKALDVKAGGGMKKKKKQKKLIQDHKSLIKEGELIPAGGSNETEINAEEDEDIYNEGNRSGGEREKGSSYDHHLTPAEKRYIEQRERIDSHKLKKTANKSHRDRIQDFNQYLANMSEHYDIPKVGPG